MHRWTCVPAMVSVALISAAAARAQGQAAPSAPEFSVEPIEFSGLLDAYYSLNFNHPASRTNVLRNFDVQANQFSLNMAKLSLERLPDPLGFRVDLGFGRAFDIIHASETAPDVFRYVEQAYVAFKPAAAKGLQVDFGKFVTAAGAEVIETSSNWNYSRSLLFSWAIPYYHFGVRANVPLTSHFSAGVHFVNGWNNVEDNNSGKTVGLAGAVSTSKFTWTTTYHVGPEKTDTNRGLRHLYDTTLLLTPTPHARMYVNFDYGVDRDLVTGSKHWVGVAGAARFAVNERFALAPRLEWYNDADGFTTGSVQKLKEFTMTAEVQMAEGFLSRLEYRRDWSDIPFFDRGSTPAASRNQDTLLLGFVAYFGPKR